MSMMILVIILQFITMNFLFWNCRGAQNKRFCSIANDLRRSCKVDVMEIIDPKMNGVVANKIIEKLGFNVSFKVEAQGDMKGFSCCEMKIK